MSSSRVAVRPGPAAPAPARSSRTRLLVAAAAVVVLLAAAVWVVGFTGVLGVRTVSVLGAKAIPADQVRAAAAVPGGQPLARVDLGAVGDRVRALPGVERVAVTRSWPGTLRITVTERHGVAAVARAGDWWLVDPGGVVFQRLATRPRLPVLAVTDVGPHDDAARAALAAVTALPRSVTVQVGQVTAPTPEQVTLALTGGRTVLWGGAEDSAAKASVLTALLRRPGTHYDVSTPSVVTVR